MGIRIPRYIIGRSSEEANQIYRSDEKVQS